MNIATLTAQLMNVSRHADDIMSILKDPEIDLDLKTLAEIEYKRTEKKRHDLETALSGYLLGKPRKS